MAFLDFLKPLSSSNSTDAQKNPMPSPDAANELGIEIHCSLCGKDQNKVRKIIAGPAVYICDECIDLCKDIMSEEVDREQQQEHKEQEDDGQCACCARACKRAALSGFPVDALFCEPCMDGLRNYIRQHSGEKRQTKVEPGDRICTICRQPYSAAKLYEPTEEPLYCEFCLDDLKRLAEERKTEQK